MDEVNKIRKAFFSGENKHQIANRFNRSWDTINRIVNIPREQLMGRGKRPRRTSRVVTQETVQAIEALLQEEKTKRVKRKQRYTAQRIFHELHQKGIYHGSLRRLQEIIKEMREKHNLSKQSAYLPLEFSGNPILQIDHGEVEVQINEVTKTAYLFVAAVPGKALRYCQLFPVKSQEAWGEFHERTFRFFGGIFPRVMYDNDCVLVKKVMGRERKRTDFFHHLEEYYHFESVFCNVASGNEKGAVENAVGYCRRNFLVGRPTFDDWDQINTFLQESSLLQIQEQRHYKTQEPLIQAFVDQKSSLLPLYSPYKWRKWSSGRVNNSQLVRLDHHLYSVPQRFIGSWVDIAITPFKVEIFKDAEMIAMHNRRFDGDGSYTLDHYLEQLRYKKMALQDCKAVGRHDFPPQLREVWDRLQNKYPQTEANQQFIEILLLGRKYPKLIDAVEFALQCGSVDHFAIAHLAEQLEYSQPRCFSSFSSSREWQFDLSIYRELCEVAS